jgi:hypothetical protein
LICGRLRSRACRFVRAYSTFLNSVSHTFHRCLYVIRNVCRFGVSKSNIPR